MRDGHSFALLLQFTVHEMRESSAALLWITPRSSRFRSGPCVAKFLRAVRRNDRPQNSLLKLQDASCRTCARLYLCALYRGLGAERIRRAERRVPIKRTAHQPAFRCSRRHRHPWHHERRCDRRRRIGTGLENLPGVCALRFKSNVLVADEQHVTTAA